MFRRAGSRDCRPWEGPSRATRTARIIALKPALGGFQSAESFPGCPKTASMHKSGTLDALFRQSRLYLFQAVTLLHRFPHISFQKIHYLVPGFFLFLDREFSQDFLRGQNFSIEYVCIFPILTILFPICIDHGSG